MSNLGEDVDGNEADRRSIISAASWDSLNDGIDDLETVLYGYIHHEKNLELPEDIGLLRSSDNQTTVKLQRIINPCALEAVDHYANYLRPSSQHSQGCSCQKCLHGTTFKNSEMKNEDFASRIDNSCKSIEKGQSVKAGNLVESQELSTSKEVASKRTSCNSPKPVKKIQELSASEGVNQGSLSNSPKVVKKIQEVGATDKVNQRTSSNSPNPVKYTTHELGSRKEVVCEKNSKSQTKNIADECVIVIDSESDTSIAELPVPERPPPDVIMVESSGGESPHKCNDIEKERMSPQVKVHVEKTDNSPIVNVKKSSKRRKRKKREKDNSLIENVLSDEEIVLVEQNRLTEISNTSITINVSHEISDGLHPENTISSKKRRNLGPETKARNKTTASNLHGSKAWPKDMTEFYSEHWGDVNFDVGKLQRAMPVGANWDVDNTDKYAYCRGDRYYNKKVRCRNCNQWGHAMRRCPDPIRKIYCHMCGKEGHQEPRCTNKICLSCGEKSDFFSWACRTCRNEMPSRVCDICNQQGHEQDSCPDLWRRYHLTTQPGELVVSANSSTIKNRRQLFCSNCTRRGHANHDCTRRRFSQYFPVTQYIISYGAQEDEVTRVYGENYERRDPTTNEHEIHCPLQGQNVELLRYLGSKHIGKLKEKYNVQIDVSQDGTHIVFKGANARKAEVKVNKFLEKKRKRKLEKEQENEANALAESSRDEPPETYIDLDQYNSVESCEEEHITSSSNQFGTSEQEEELQLFQQYNKVVQDDNPGKALPNKRAKLISVVDRSIDELGNIDSNLNLYKLASRAQKFAGVCSQKCVTNRSMSRGLKNCRRLNMILLGKFGLGPGARHLQKLKEAVTKLRKSKSTVVTREMKEEIGIHYDALFTGYIRDDWHHLIRKHCKLGNNHYKPWMCKELMFNGKNPNPRFSQLRKSGIKRQKRRNIFNEIEHNKRYCAPQSM